MLLSYNELSEQIGAKAIEKLFNNGHPSSGVLYEIDGWDIEWSASKGEFYLGWTHKGKKS